MTKRVSPSWLFAAFVALFFVAIVACTNSGGVNVNDLPDGLYADMVTTKGEMVLALEFEKAPITVMNFVGLAEGKLDTRVKKGQKFYDGIIFHRIIKDFMIQGGDPDGRGTGGPGYQFPDEFDPSLTFGGSGILAMANSGPGTNGSQFFITLAETPWLNGKHTIFGHVVKGQDVLTALGTVKTAPGDRPVDQISITSLTIIRKGTKAEAFKVDQAGFDKAIGGIQEANNKKQEAAIQKMIPNGQKTADGIVYEITKPGSGASPKAGQTVSMHYTGKLLDGTTFDSSVNRGPFETQIGVGRVIKSWDEMVLQMKVGEKRRMVAPPELAYGSRGAGGVIPPNAYLYFEMELLAIK